METLKTDSQSEDRDGYFNAKQLCLKELLPCGHQKANGNLCG